MKKLIILAAMTASFAMVAGIANAGTPGSQSNGQTDKMTGHNNAASYTDGFFGPVTCNETQHPQFDTVSCRMATPNAALAGVSSTVGWLSDFNGKYGTLTYTVSADGSSYTAHATY
jgi:hypothetical protein